MALKLVQTDIDFILAQLRLPNNRPATPIDSTGIRDVQGVGNNPLHPTWGSADQPFPRLFTQHYIQADNIDPLTGQRAFYSTVAPVTPQNHGVVIVDSSPREISNLVSNETVAHPNTPVAGLVNPLPYSGWTTLFGQFFDHGLDFVAKGTPGLIAIPLLPGDPLFNPAFASGQGTNVMYVSRVNTTSVQPGADGILGTADDQRESANTVSPFIDLSQSYGSLAGHTAFLREYDDATNTATGRLTSGANGTGMATWADIKSNIAKIGLTLHDVDVNDIPMVALNADGTVRIFGDGNARFVLANGSFTRDSADTAGGGVQRIGHAFLNDMGHPISAALGTPSALTPQGDIIDPVKSAALAAHYIAGDGRTNENIGLTAVHDVFHAEHNRVLIDIQAMVKGGVDSYGQTWTARPDAATWTGEDFFQAAKLVTEMEYQHMVFGEFARKVSPNIGAFAGLDMNLDPSITAEFAHAVYRFGHSMLTETVDRFDANGNVVAGSTPGQQIGLIEAFLNPGEYAKYGDESAADIARGMTRQVGNEIDELVTGALRNNLVGLPLDLAAINITRGRDTGMPTLNEARAQIYAATNGDTAFKPYTDWVDLGRNLLHPESLRNFIAAYSRDAILTTFGGNADVAYWDGLQISNPTLYATALGAAADAALGDSAFMYGDQGFQRIDLWIGGLAEQKVQFGMLGPVFDFVFAQQMTLLQNNDRFYYLERLLGTNLLPQIEGQLFSDIIARNTTADYLYADVFSVADATIDMSNPATWNTHRPVGQSPNVVTDAGYSGPPGSTTFYGRSGDYVDARGVLNPNGRGNASEVIIGTDGNDSINAGGGNDTVYGKAGNDTIEGGKGNDFVHAGDGDDVITDSEGADLIWGEAGNDTMNGGVGVDQLFGGDGNDVMHGGRGADVLNGDAGDDVMYGDEDTDAMNGGAGNDVMYGGDGADTINGDDGNDTIYGGAGADAMDGLAGDDLFIMDATDIGYNHIISGGININGLNDGIDTVSYAASVQGVNIDLMNAGNAVVPPGANVADSFTFVENLIGSAFNDTLNGNDDANVIEGGLGNDVMSGAGFNKPDIVGVADTLSFESSVTNITANLATGIATGAGNDTFTFFENLRGGQANDTLTGDAGNNVLEGLAGNDVMDGGVGADTMMGGLGNDTYTVDNVADVFLEAEEVPGANPAIFGGVDTLRIGTVASWTLGQYWENLTYTGTAAFTGTGNASDNVIIGGAAADRLVGLAGNDTLDGGAGNDTMTGGIGDDTYVISALTDVIVENANEGSDTLAIGFNTASTTLNVANIENLAYRGTGNWTGTGDAAANVITGNAGADTLNGLGGNDTLQGNAGNDTLDGGTGNDTMIGGTGNDTYVVDALGDVVTELAGEGTDTVRTAINNYVLSANVEALVYTGAANFTATASNTGSSITGGAGADTLNGGSGNDSLFGLGGQDTLSGNGGNDLLDGGTGADRMSGGAGDDTFVVDNVGDQVLENASEGVDTVQTTLGSYTLGANVENLSYTGTGAFNGTGNALDNVMNGSSGVDVLNGGDGNDTLNGGTGNDLLTGGLGNDVLNGGTGSDSMTGGAGDDTYSVDNVGDVVTEGVGGGVDTVLVSTLASYTLGANVENLTNTGAAGFTATGNALANVINGGTGTDRILGGDGADTLNGNNGNDFITGGLGVDTMRGGAGTDAFILTASNESGNTALTRDVILDFVRGTDDIDVSLIDANATVGGNNAFTWRGTQAFNGAGQLRMALENVGGQDFTVIQANMDANTATIEFSIALLGNYTTGANTLQANDFIL